MDAIYDEMYERNTAWLLNNPVIVDPLLLTPELDDRQCIALVAKDPITIVDINVLAEISAPLLSKWMSPRIHHTFIILRRWSNDKREKEQSWEPVKSIIRDNLTSYDIVFDRVIPVKTGLVICGTASIDINAVREKILAAGYGAGALYKCDIIHATLLRWTVPLTPGEQTEWLAKMMALYKDPGPNIYAKMTVTGFDIVLASWTMLNGSYEILDSIDLSH